MTILSAHREVCRRRASRIAPVLVTAALFALTLGIAAAVTAHWRAGAFWAVLLPQPTDGRTVEVYNATAQPLVVTVTAHFADQTTQTVTLRVAPHQRERMIAARRAVRFTVRSGHTTRTLVPPLWEDLAPEISHLRTR